MSDDYERTRPGYPSEAVAWLMDNEPEQVLDLGCGPGKLTAQLAALGFTTIGVDPSMQMLRGMRDKGLPAICARAENLPVRSATADLVTAATAFHWFDHERAVPEMCRVLRPGGRVALLTNIRDETVPWVKSLSEIIGSEAAMAATLGGAEGMEAEYVAKLEDGDLFHSTEHRVFNLEQQLTEERLVGLVRSRSYIAILPEVERDQLLAEVRGLCREHPQLRNQQSFAMPYKTHAFRAKAS